MRYEHPQLRDRLASEYVMGTLRGGARARFDALLRYDPGLRGLVADWEALLGPLALAAGDIAPPERVWKSLSQRIAGTTRGLDAAFSIAFWRGLAVTTSALALVLGIIVGMTPRHEPPMAMVAVMNDDHGTPALVVSWPPMKSMRDPHIRVKVVQQHPVMDAGTSWEMWLLPGNKAAPVSLGLISTDRDQVMKIDPALVHRMGEAWGIAMSVEPEKGSPTGVPTGPVIFKGQCVRML